MAPGVSRRKCPLFQLLVLPMASCIAFAGHLPSSALHTSMGAAGMARSPLLVPHGIGVGGRSCHSLGRGDPDFLPSQYRPNYFKMRTLGRQVSVEGQEELRVINVVSYVTRCASSFHTDSFQAPHAAPPCGLARMDLAWYAEEGAAEVTYPGAMGTAVMETVTMSTVPAQDRCC
jgi:hypothetical protein